MGQTNSTTQNPTRRNKKLINSRYNKKQQALDLAQQSNDWRSVLESQDWTALRTLNLDSCKIDDIGAEFLGSLPWPNLQSLNLRYNHITGAGLEKLLAQEFPQLQQLQLYCNNIGDEGMRVLSTAHVHSPSLQVLSIMSNKISAVGMLQVLSWKLSQLKELSLFSNNIGSAGAKLLNKGQFPLLQQLSLYYCKLGDEGGKHLAKGHWPKLQRLGISTNKIQFDGCTAIATTNWKQLEHIELCLTSDRIAVTTFSLVASNSPYHTKISYRFTSKLQQKVKIVLLYRFSQAE